MVVATFSLLEIGTMVLVVIVAPNRYVNMDIEQEIYSFTNSGGIIVCCMINYVHKKLAP